ncbi:hypothetical protein [Pseudophaeobacter sp.]|uniref:hypothetical protein n=1 Tax=Pseudophaeobacter sp. TaxID=1971739 RepID=UPI003299AC5C
MLISHGARMTFDRFSRLASIPALPFNRFDQALARLQAAWLLGFRDMDIQRGLDRLIAPALHTAGLQAQRATALLPRGSVTWRREQTVLQAFEQNQKRNRR